MKNLKQTSQKDVDNRMQQRIRTTNSHRKENGFQTSESRFYIVRSLLRRDARNRL